MLERLIKQCKARIKGLENLMEDEDLTPEEARDLLEKYEEAHALLDSLTGDKGDKRPQD